MFGDRLDRLDTLNPRPLPAGASFDLAAVNVSTPSRLLLESPWSAMALCVFSSFRVYACSRCRSRRTSSASSCPNRLRHRYIVCSEMLCFFAVSATVPASASRRIRTVCSSEDLTFFIASPCPKKAIIPRINRSENHPASHPAASNSLPLRNL